MTITRLTIVYGELFSVMDLVRVLQVIDKEKFDKYQPLIDIGMLLELEKEREFDLRSDEWFELQLKLESESFEVEGTTFQLYHFAHDVERSEKTPWVVGVWLEKVIWPDYTHNWKVKSRERDFDHLDRCFRKYIKINAEPKKHAIPNDCQCCS